MKYCVDCSDLAMRECDSCGYPLCDNHAILMDEGYITCEEQDCIRGLLGYD